MKKLKNATLRAVLVSMLLLLVWKSSQEYRSYRMMSNMLDLVGQTCEQTGFPYLKSVGYDQ